MVGLKWYVTDIHVCSKDLNTLKKGMNELTDGQMMKKQYETLDLML